jgi:tetraacyldisaccharide 4'-kinase
MKLSKPNFWNRKNNIYSFLLLPISFLLIIIIFFKKKFSKPINFKIPIICVGNIYIGGTGKTPSSIFLANELLKLNKNPAILRKYYKNHSDEYDLIKENFNNLIINTNRVAAVIEAKKANYDVIILDDGFQDYQIKKDLNILCFNENQLIGNGLVIPAGPLRETMLALKDAHIILINGKKNYGFEKKILNINNNLEIFYSNYVPIDINRFRNKKLLAIAGIGNPDNFFKLIERNNLRIEKKIIFPDHYEFTKYEVQNIVDEAKIKNYQIIMTEKDYFKIKKFNFKSIEYLKILLKINDKDKFLTLIKKSYDKAN